MEVVQRVEIILMMAKLESVTLVRRELQKRKWTNIPHENTIRNLFKKFKNIGSVQEAPRSGRPSLDETKSEEILKIFQNQPSTSIRQAASAISCSYGYVHKVLKHDLKFFPYKIQVTQELHEEDFSLRVSMCETLLEKTEEDKNFLKKIIFSDESTFRLDGIVNRHNCRIWGRRKARRNISALPSFKSPSQCLDGNFKPKDTWSLFLWRKRYWRKLSSHVATKLSPTTLEKRQAFFQQDGPGHHLITQSPSGNFLMTISTIVGLVDVALWWGPPGLPTYPLWTSSCGDSWRHRFFLTSENPARNERLHFSCKWRNYSPMCRSAIVSFEKRLQKCIDAAGGTNVEQWLLFSCFFLYLKCK